MRIIKNIRSHLHPQDSKSFVSGLYTFFNDEFLRIVSKQSVNHHTLSNTELNNGCKIGIDTHTDTSSAGKHMRILEIIDGPKLDVTSFKGPSFQNVIMINGTVTADRSDRKDGYILELNKSLNFSENIKHSLLCLILAKVNNVIVNDVPKSLTLSSS